MNDDLHTVLGDLVNRLQRRPSGELAVGGMALGVASETTDEVERLRVHLYRHYYLTGGRPARANGAPLLMWRGGRRSALHAKATETVMPVEVLETHGTHSLVLEPGSKLRLRTATGQLWSVGDVTTTPLAAVRPHLSPGFTVFDSAQPMSAREALWRLYFNAESSLMSGFLDALTSALASCPPHRFKAYTGAEARADSVVLYFPASDYTAVRRALGRAGVLTHEALRPWTPLFTRVVAPGVAVAEDPGGALSFGEDRCERVARALLDLLQARRRLARADLPKLVERLAIAGLDADQPHRTSARPLWRGRRRSTRPDSTPVHSAEDALEACVEAVVQSSIAAGDKITWLARAGGGLNVLSAARADVYSGASGIGWFLAEAAAWRGSDPEGMAERVCSKAVEAAFGFDPDAQHNLYSGPIGAALAAHRAADCLQSSSLAARARALAESTVANLPPASAAPSTDWLGGLAGAAAGLLQAWRIWGLENARDATDSIADEIVGRACHFSTSSAWPLPQARRLRPLTGFSHGAGGIGLALLMIGQTLGRGDLIALAARGFAYENASYSFAQKAWPDLRPGQGGFPKAWCHGSPGILLSHAIAHRLAPEVAPWDRRHTRAVEAMLSANFASTCAGAEPCLCHGYVGNLEIAALLAERGFAPRAALPVCLAAQVSQDIGRFSAPSSAAIRDSSLMLGVSGIGMFILRRMLHAEGPSPLMLGIAYQGR